MVLRRKERAMKGIEETLMDGMEEGDDERERWERRGGYDGGEEVQ